MNFYAGNYVKVCKKGEEFVPCMKAKIGEVLKVVKVVGNEITLEDGYIYLSHNLKREEREKPEKAKEKRSIEIDSTW